MPKISPGAYNFQRTFFRGLFLEGPIFRGAHLRREICISQSSLIVGSKFTVFALFYFIFEGNFASTSPQGAYIWRGNLTEEFLHYPFGGLILEGGYTWRGLFLEFYGTYCLSFKRPFIPLFVNLKGTKNKQHCCSNGAVDVSPISCVVGIERGRETGNSSATRVRAAVSFAATWAGAPCPYVVSIDSSPSGGKVV